MATDLLADPTIVSILMILIGIVIANILTKGFLRAIILTKVFRKGNILVCVAHSIQDYYVPGKLDTNALEFTKRKRADNPKPKCVIGFKDEDNRDNGGYDTVKKAIYKSFGIECVMIDDVKNSIYLRHNGSFESVGGFNAEAMAEKIDTALKKPPEDEVGLMPAKKFQIMVLILLVILGVGIYILYNQGKTADAHNKVLYDVVVASLNQTGV